MVELWLTQTDWDNIKDILVGVGVFIFALVWLAWIWKMTDR